jgi:hypothetical protein
MRKGDANACSKSHPTLTKSHVYYQCELHTWLWELLGWNSLQSHAVKSILASFYFSISSNIYILYRIFVVKKIFNLKALIRYCNSSYLCLFASAIKTLLNVRISIIWPSDLKKINGLIIFYVHPHFDFRCGDICSLVVLQYFMQSQKS